jgi:hypothetical protein
MAALIIQQPTLPRQLVRGFSFPVMDTAEVMQNLSTIVDLLPANEAQARPLARLEPEQQREVWQQVIDKAPSTGITNERHCNNPTR